jgi:renalase
MDDEARNDATRIAVVGAGMAGLACAAALVKAGRSVTLFDKGRRPGGRVATRRAEIAGHGTVSFDHGAQFATARGNLLPWLEAERDRGDAAPWPAADAGGSPRWAGIPGMSALPRSLAAALPAAQAEQKMARHVAFLRRAAAGWMLRHLPSDTARPGQVTDEGDLAGPFDVVLLALPSPQAAPLLRAAGHAFADDAARAVIAPCWAAMIAKASPVPGPDVLRPENGPIAWAARESSRPGRTPGSVPDCWVIHATPAWTRAHLEHGADEVAALLDAEFTALTGSDEPALYRAAHRWRHALVETALGTPCLWDPATRLGLCGDWCIGPRIEAAYESGTALAQAVLTDAAKAA